MLNLNSKQVLAQFENCFKQSKSAAMLEDVNWPEDLSFITFRSTSCVLDKDELIAQIKKSIIQMERQRSVSTKLVIDNAIVFLF